jgi:hypothetical protein
VGESEEAIMSGDAGERLVCDKIVSTFGDLPRPSQYLRWDFTPYDEREDRFDYLIGKTWREVGADAVYLGDHISEEFFIMTAECFFYYFPGYLWGALRHDVDDTLALAASLVGILRGRGAETWQDELVSLLIEKLSDDQKAVVAEWLAVMRRRGLQDVRYVNRGVYRVCGVALETWAQWSR